MRHRLRALLAASILCGCAGRHVPLPDCKHVAEQLIGPEDFALDDRTQPQRPRLLVSARATRPCEQDRHEANNGIWVLDVSQSTSPSPVQMLIYDGETQCTVAGPHGIALARAEGAAPMLFVINEYGCRGNVNPCACIHDAAHFSVERYRVEADHLVFEERYESPLLEHPNDLDVSADGSEWYLSNARPGGNVLHGVRTAPNTAAWSIADADLAWANGVALDEARDRLYVAETMRNQVRVYDIQRARDPRHDSIALAGRIDLGSSPDNLSWANEAKTRMYVAADPSLIRVLGNFWLHWTSPSEVYVIENLDREPIWHAVYGDDGEISAASTALPVNGRLYIGEAADPGLLSCAFDPSKAVASCTAAP
jgi:hypothetical protein